MTYAVRLSPRVERELKRLPANIYHRVLVALVSVASNPYEGKPLQGQLKGYYSYRVWPYRIIYTIIKKELIVIVIRIGHRRDVYR